MAEAKQVLRGYGRVYVRVYGRVCGRVYERVCRSVYEREYPFTNMSY